MSFKMSIVSSAMLYKEGAKPAMNVFNCIDYFSETSNTSYS